MACAGGTCLDRFDVCPHELALDDDRVPVPNAACDNDPDLRVVDGRCVWIAPDTAPTTTFAVARANCARAGGVLAPALPGLLADVESGGQRSVWAGVCQERYPALGDIFTSELGIYASYASLSGEPLGLDVTQETGGGCYVPRGGIDFNDIQIECASDLISSACVFDRPGGVVVPGPGGSLDLRGSTSAAVAWPFDRTMPDFAGSAGLSVELRVFVHSQTDGGAHRTRLLRTPDWEFVYSMTSGVSLRVNSTTSVTIPASVLPTDQWVSLALTYANVASGGSGSGLAGTLRLFVNGELRGSARVGGTTASVAARVLRPTRHMPVQLGNGPDEMSLSVDDVRLWSRIRSDAEVLGDFDQKAIPPDAPGLVAHFTFDETAAELSAADRVLDRSGNGLDAELVNNARRGADSELP
jgi:hypothetical protein